MLENIRESSQGMAAKIILGLVILTFALAGIGSYTNSVDTSVAEVNGEKISQNDFNKAYQSQRNRMAQQFGEMFETLSADANYMSNFRNGVLDNLINEVLIKQNADKLAIRVSDEMIKQTILDMQEFQVDGVFDNNRYLAIINQAGFYQSSDFRDYLRVEMTRRQLTQALIATEFSLPYQENMISALQNQTRDLRFATISAEQFKATIAVEDEEVSSYYQENIARFQNQEKVKVDYIILNVNDIAGDVDVTEEDIQTYYQENMAKYREDEQRRISHILIEFGDDEAAAKTQAEDILTRINNGEEFATLAKELSADTFSGENGGDLEWLEKGTMDEAFDEAAFALETVGSVSEVVKTEFGFHILTMTEHKAEEIVALADVKDDIKRDVSTQIAQDNYYELQQEMARLSFELPDSLDDAAAAINGKVQTSDWLTRGQNAAPFNDSKVIEAAFSDIVINENVNTDVIEVSDTQALVLRMNEYQEAKARPLEDVSEQIKQILITRKASEKAKEVAEQLLAEFNAGTDITAKLAESNTEYTVKSAVNRNGSDVDRAIVNKAFAMPHPKEGVVSASVVALSNGDNAIVEVQAVNETAATETANMSQQQTSQLAQSAYLAYINSLKSEAEITRNVSNAVPAQY